MNYPKTPVNKATRIRYKKEAECYRSVKSFLGNEGVLLYVMIDIVSNTVAVMNNGTPMESVTSTSFNESKAKAKELLKKYGVNFYSEVRRKEVKNDAEGV